MKKKKIIGVSALVIGLVTLVAGIVCLTMNLAKSDRLADGEFLVSVGEWTLSETSGEVVVWNFTEIGKGILTTNAHQNDYDFLWALEGGRMKIEADWLETLEDEYRYTLDQEAKVLTLSKGDLQVKFIAK